MGIPYHVSIWADGLPTNKDKADPYVVVKMGSSKAETEHLSNRFFNVMFKQPVKVMTQPMDRKCTLELWDANTWLIGNDWLFGEANIYNVEPDKVFWRHVYGGAFNALYGNYADQMVRGSMRPSTYHGTIAVSFSTKPKPPADFQHKVKRERRQGRLVVRLYRAIYLDKKLAKKRVSIVVQMAGAFL